MLLVVLMAHVSVSSPHFPPLQAVGKRDSELSQRRDNAAAGQADAPGAQGVGPHIDAQEVQAARDRLRYWERAYRLLCATLLAAAPARSFLAGTDAVLQVSQRCALLAAGSCLAVHAEYHRQRLGPGLGAPSAALRTKADVRARLQVSMQGLAEARLGMCCASQC